MRYIFVKVYFETFLLVCVMIKEILNILCKEFSKEPQFCQPKITINMLHIPSSFLCIYLLILQVNSVFTAYILRIFFCLLNRLF